VALPPQCDNLDRKIIEAALRPGASGLGLRALDATPARETLMISIMRNAAAPFGCVPDLSRFEH
jgi:hypothetical protein